MSKKSRDYFDKALKIAPDFFAIKVLMAELYAPKVKDRALFETELRRIIDTPEDRAPDHQLLNQVAKARARLLLERADELFL